MSHSKNPQHQSIARGILDAVFGGLRDAISGAFAAPVMGGLLGLAGGIYMVVAEGHEADMILYGLVIGAILGVAFKIFDIFS